ncbi:MAG: hypothetical protein HY471_02460 [Candidatus Sungbacteria bacterium]|nr:hypothetical protein [Candidatus Sungbacteria bacterium]
MFDFWIRRKLKPFSDNLIFWDTEFSTLDPYKGEIISLGMVKMTGEKLYLELEHEGECSQFVEEHVLPHMTGTKVSRESAKQSIIQFLGEGRPFLMSYINVYDAIYLLKLFNPGGESTKDAPFHWIFLDFASMLFAVRRDPSVFSGKRTSVLGLTAEFGIDASQYREHHALDDAERLRDIYLKIIA